jgi:SAM-dependent methyltransferase
VVIHAQDVIQRADSGTHGGAYWDEVLESWEPTLAHQLWRAHSDAVNTKLLRRWLPAGDGVLLKTDLFDEAVGQGLYPELAARVAEVVGIDVSPAVVSAATRRYPDLEAHVGDVLALPFADESFDVVVSNSTLDHFDSHTKLRIAVAELGRSIRPGGKLIVTLDNRMNPIVALRTSGLFETLHRLRIVPYYVGATQGPHGLSQLLDNSGFTVAEITSVMHCPPQLAAWLVACRRGALDPRGDAQRSHLKRMLRWEAMERWPTRHLTGHFVAACAVRR